MKKNNLNSFRNLLVALNIITISLTTYYLFGSMKSIQAQEVGLSNSSLLQVIADTMTSNLKLGQHSEVHRECRKIYQNSNINNIKVLTDDGLDLCNLGRKKEVTSPPLDKVLYFDDNLKSILGRIEIEFTNNSTDTSHIIYITLSLYLIINIFLFYLISGMISKNITTPIKLLSSAVKGRTLEESKYNIEETSISNLEISFLRDSLLSLISVAIERQDQDLKINQLETRNILAKQVAHDIKSPLASLRIVSEEIDQLPSDLRQILLASINRIHDIANELLYSHQEKSKELTSLDEKNINIYPLILEIISEKKTQYKSKTNIEIILNSVNVPDQNISFNPSTLKSIISNLLNNAFEELWTTGGKISIQTLATDNTVSIIIEDSGKGIPEHLSEIVFEEGTSLGKKEINDSGSGLGLFLAKRELSKRHSQILLNKSSLGGAQFWLTFPKSTPPNWLAQSIQIVSQKRIIILDDDQSVFKSWERLFASQKIPTNLLSYYQNVNDFINDLPQISKSNFTLLLDFHFSQESTNGHEILMSYPFLREKTYLVTNQFEDERIIELTEIYGLKVIPKSLLPFIILSK